MFEKNEIKSIFKLEPVFLSIKNKEVKLDKEEGKVTMTIFFDDNILYEARVEEKLGKDDLEDSIKLTNKITDMEIKAKNKAKEFKENMLKAYTNLLVTFRATAKTTKSKVKMTVEDFMKLLAEKLMEQYNYHVDYINYNDDEDMYFASIKSEFEDEGLVLYSKDILLEVWAEDVKKTLFIVFEPEEESNHK